MPNFNFNFSKCIIGFILFAFAAVGITGGISQFSDKGAKISKVGNVNILQEDFDRLYDREANNLQRITGRKVSKQELDLAGLSDNILRVLEEHALIVNYLNDIGLRMRDEDIYSYIKSNEVFFDENGLFSQKKFESLLKENDLSTEKYFDTLKDSILQSILLSALFSHSIKVSPISSIFTELRYKTKVADLIRVDNSFLDGQKFVISDQEIYDFYENNKADFMSQSKRKASFILASFDDTKKSINVTDDEFSKVLEEFVTKENARGTRDFINVIFPSYQLAADAKAKLDQGEDFDNVVNSLSDKGVLKNSINEVDQRELPNIVGDALFSMQEAGQVSDILSTEFGWHILKLQKIHVYSREDLSDIVREQMINERAVDVFGKLVNSLEEYSKSGKNINEIGNLLNLKVHNTEWISSIGDNIADDNAAGLPRVFVDSVFETNIDQYSDVFADNNGNNYYLVTPKEAQESRQLSLEEVKGKINTMLTDKQKKAKLNSIAESVRLNLIDSSGKGISSNSLVKVVGRKNVNLNQVIYSPIISNRMGIEYPLEFVNSIFSLKDPGEVSKVFNNGSDGYLIAVLRSSFDAGSIDNYAEKFENTNLELSSSFRSSIHEAMINYLKTKYKIKRYV